MDVSEDSIQDLISPQLLNTEFKIKKDVCYLDHVGAALYPASLVESYSKDLCSNLYGNPHSNSLGSKLTSDTIDQVRYKILQYFNTDIDEYSVVFTSGATEALRIVAESFDFTGTEQLENGLQYTVKYNGNSGDFVYMQDNHTSVLGMRNSKNITSNVNKPIKIRCITHDKAFSIFGKENELQSDSSCTVYSGNSLFVYSSQCNFSGIKYPLSWIEKTKCGLLQRDHSGISRWFCFLDAASFVSTNALDLSSVKPDFVCISFYKIFGFPTGLGALLVRNSSAHVLNKDYYGGGTVLIALSLKPYHVLRPVLHERFEDGTVNFLSIVALNHCLNTFQNLGLTMEKISLHCFSLARYAYRQLLQLHHSNGTPAVVLYNDTDYQDQRTQGGVVTFNMIRHSGEYIGFAEVLNMANLYGIHLRSGCFCNPGACQRHLRLSDEQLCFNFQAGHVCGDDKDLINGLPTGAVRASFGYYSTKRDVDTLINMLSECFVSKPCIIKIPENFNEKTELLRNKLCNITINGSTPMKHATGTEVEHPQVQKWVDTNELCVYKQLISTDSQLILSHIFIYPIKSCGYFSAPQWPLNRRGLLYDRQWMVVTETSIALTQKQEPRLCLVRPVIDLQHRVLRLTAEGFTDCTIELELKENVPIMNKASFCQSKVCGDQVKGIDCGSEVASWLCAVIGRQGLRLFRQQARTKRKMINDAVSTNDSLSLSNQAQFLLVSETSVSWLSNRLQDNSDCSKESMVHRFRSNFVIKGVSEPFEEKYWTDIRIGDVTFKVDAPCNRCQMICIDQSTGAKTKEPLTTLTASLQGKMNFGIYLSQQSAPDLECTIKIGDICKPLTKISNSV